MSLLKYLQRFERMHWLIQHSATGCCDEFARKMGLSRRQLLENISELKAMGAPIKYSHTSSTYYYEHDWQPFNRITSKGLNRIKGGRKNFRILFNGAVLPHHGNVNLGNFC